MLPSAGLGNDSCLVHPSSEQNLADRVVDFVGAGVCEIFAFQPDCGAACTCTQTGSWGKWCFAANEVAEF
jgi:hypothetical protein